MSKDGFEPQEKIDGHKGIDFSKILKDRGINKIEPHATIDGVLVEFDKIPDRSITMEQWKTVRANTPGFRALYPKLNDEALLDTVQNHLNNISRHDDCTYDYSLAYSLVPEMMKRLNVPVEQHFGKVQYEDMTTKNRIGKAQLSLNGFTFDEIFEKYLLSGKRIYLTIREE